MLAHVAGGFRHPIQASHRAELVAAYRQKFPVAATSEVAAAEQLAAHRFTLLGHTSAHGARIGWSVDPVTGREWPRGLSADIPYRGSRRLGDIKLPWELAKHQYFFTLGKTAWLEQDPAFSLEIINQIADWIDDNPYQRGVHWISALEVGSRAISWILAYPFYAEHCPADAHQSIASSLGRQLMFVEQHLSLGPYANTHLAGEAAALIAGGLFLDCRHSDRWLSRGIELLEAQLTAQVTADGVHAERSLAYHRFFLDQYFLAAALLAANGRSLSASSLQRVEAMAGVLAHFVFPDGTAANFGDADDARGLWLHAGAAADYRGPIALGAAWFGRPDFKALAGGASEEVLWLLGTEGLDRYERLVPELPPQPSTSYPASGYYVLRSGWDQAASVLFADCGPLGFGPGAHAHSDALSFQLFAGGYPFLVDPGTFSYNIDYAWRDAFRTTRAHNTAIVDGQDQSIPGERLSWQTRATAHVRGWISTEWADILDGQHDGYARLRDPVIHRRTMVFLKPDVWIIRDEFVATGNHQVEVLFHVRPECDITFPARERALDLAGPRGERLAVAVLHAGPEAALEVISGSETHRWAWFSDGYGVRTPAKVIRVSDRSVGRHSIVTSLATPGGLTPRVSLDGDGLEARLDRGQGMEDQLFFTSTGCRRRLSVAPRFDGLFLFRRDIREAVAILRAERFHELSLPDWLEVRSPQLIDTLTLQGDRCEIVMTMGGADDLHMEARPGVVVSVTSR